MRLAVTSFLLVLLATPWARGLTVRYAVVVGCNRGVDRDGAEPFPPLVHAQHEARRLRQRLVRVANFDPSAERTVLLQGATRASLEEAFSTVARARQQDLRRLGPARSLFLFFFTGHGLQGRILLEDGPVTASELGAMIKRVGADFTVGAFDACYAGSLDPDTLHEKGVGGNPGLDLFRELPEEVLTAEGSVWFVSSGPGQASYEDERLGGVFTHYFIEALDQAERDGPGITLDRIWHYVRQNTTAYTLERNRHQVPQQYVARLHAAGPLYFSFPLERSATLVLGESVRGRYLLSYADGQLTEMVSKRAGERTELAVYPGEARLVKLVPGGVGPPRSLVLAPGGRLEVLGGSDPAPASGLGHKTVSLWEDKGEAGTIRAAAVQPGTSVLLGAGYEAGLGSPDALDPRHLALVRARVDHGGLVAEAALGYGGDGRDHESWGYTLHALVAEAHAGWAFDLGPARLAAGAGLGAGRLWQEFDSGQSRRGWSLRPHAVVSLVFPAGGRLAVEALLRGGAARVPGAAAGSAYRWTGWFGGGLAVVVRVR